MENYIITCDESTRHGKEYSYFYGGAIVAERKYESITNKLNLFKNNIGLNHELKRTNIDPLNANRYIEILDFFFTFVKSGDIRVRVMFSDNDKLIEIPSSMDETFSKFYYLFVRHAFSLPYAKEDINLRLIFDALPESNSVRERFKHYLISNLTHIPEEQNFKHNNVFLTRDRIEEVDSKKHIILQCVDVIVGLIDFHLNDKKSPELRGKRWYAKNKVFEVLREYVEELHPNFDLIKTTQPYKGYKSWIKHYRHFIFNSQKKQAPALSN